MHAQYMHTALLLANSVGSHAATSATHPALHAPGWGVLPCCSYYGRKCLACTIYICPAYGGARIGQTGRCSCESPQISAVGGRMRGATSVMVVQGRGGRPQGKPPQEEIWEPGSSFTLSLALFLITSLQIHSVRFPHLLIRLPPFSESSQKTFG